MTRAVFAAGAPAREVFDEVALEGRFGVVLQVELAKAEAEGTRDDRDRGADRPGRRPKAEAREAQEAAEALPQADAARRGRVRFGAAQGGVAGGVNTTWWRLPLTNRACRGRLDAPSPSRRRMAGGRRGRCHERVAWAC
jgi:hypothetical protein